MGKWSAATLNRVRRLRKARRLYKAMPLFAYDILQKEYPGYSYEAFLQDIQPRKKKLRPKTHKSRRVRFGRYFEMQRMARRYNETQNPVYGLKANQLRKYLSKPYRVLISINNQVQEYSYPATISITLIQQLVTMAGSCQDFTEYEQKEREVLRYSITH